jgi:hypothetical protein
VRIETCTNIRALQIIQIWLTKHVTLEEKIQAIKKLDAGTPAYKIAEEMGVGKTQIQTLRKRKADI